MLSYTLGLSLLLALLGVASCKSQEPPFALEGNRFELQTISVFEDPQRGVPLLAVDEPGKDALLWNPENKTVFEELAFDDRVTLLIETVTHPSSGETYIATAGRKVGTTDFTINIWSFGSGNLIAQSAGSSILIVDMEFVVDPTRNEVILAVASLDGVLRLYRLTDLNAPAVSVLAHVPFIGAITTLNTDMTGGSGVVTIVTGGSDDMKTWSYTNGSLTKVSSRLDHFGAITSLSSIFDVDRGEELVISVGTDNFISIWSLKQQTPIFRFQTPGPSVEAVTSARHLGIAFVVAAFNMTIMAWELPYLLDGDLDGFVVNKQNVGKIRSIIGYFSPNGEGRVASAGQELWIWGIKSDKPTRSPTPPHTLSPTFSPTYMLDVTVEPTSTPTSLPTQGPTSLYIVPSPPTFPTVSAPSSQPSSSPTRAPLPTSVPSQSPSIMPTSSPSNLDSLIQKKVRVVFSRVRLVESHLDPAVGFDKHFRENFVEPIVSKPVAISVVVDPSQHESLTVDLSFYVKYDVSFVFEDFTSNINTKVNMLKLRQQNKFCLQSDARAVELPMQTPFPTSPPTNAPPAVEAAAIIFGVLGIFGCFVGTGFALRNDDHEFGKLLLSVILSLIDTLTDVLFVWAQWNTNATLAAVSLFTLIGFIGVHFVIGCFTLGGNRFAIERDPVAILITMASSFLSSTIMCFVYDVEEMYLDYATFADLAEDTYQAFLAILALSNSIDTVSIVSLVVSSLSIVWRIMQLYLVS